MQREANKAIIRRYYEEIVNRSNLAAIHDIVVQQYVTDVNQLVTMLHTAFPDFYVELEDLIKCWLIRE